jgi:hypothetical protein
MAVRCGNHRGSPSPVYHDDVAAVRACCEGKPTMGRPSPIAPSVEPREITEGMWYIGERIVKVQRAVHGSQHLYTKELVRIEPARGDDGEDISPGSWEFERLYGGMKELRKGENVRKMTLEEAVQFGKLYGICCRCAATLTDENSIAAGIGPICAGKI